MRINLGLGHCVLALVLNFCVVQTSNVTSSLLLLPKSFSPPAVFENTNLVRHINLTQSYPQETTNIVIKNVAEDAQSEYYFRLHSSLVDKVSGFKVWNRKTEHVYKVRLAAYEKPRPDSYYVITLAEPLKPLESVTISLSFALLSTTYPLPALIDQNDKQTITYEFSAYHISAYTTLKQKTNLLLPTWNLAEYTKISESDPKHQGTALTYGPYNNMPAASEKAVQVRYEFTVPMLRSTRFERDIEVSHWGGNVAFEERYWLTNRAAKLKKQFSRVDWQHAQLTDKHQNGPPSTAAKKVNLVIDGRVSDGYFIDDVGNVSTSNWRPGKRDTRLELKPRYPIFGGWNYSFKVGWNGELASYLRKISGESYVLNVPFMEGPRPSLGGLEYGSVQVRVILPEGATNVNYSTSAPVVESYLTCHKTFMDTIGRPTIILKSVNAIEEWRNGDGSSLIVTYDYPYMASFRKPITIAISMFGVFAAAWIVGNLDLRIGQAK